jgi:hypothetical protein
VAGDDLGPDAQLADQRAEPHAERLHAHQVDLLAEQPAPASSASPVLRSRYRASV